MAAATAAGAQAQQAYSATLFARRVALAREACPEQHEHDGQGPSHTISSTA